MLALGSETLAERRRPSRASFFAHRGSLIPVGCGASVICKNSMYALPGLGSETLASVGDLLRAPETFASVFFCSQGTSDHVGCGVSVICKNSMHAVPGLGSETLASIEAPHEHQGPSRGSFFIAEAAPFLGQPLFFDLGEGEKYLS